jgi:hypothetical protein
LAYESSYASGFFTLLLFDTKILHQSVSAPFSPTIFELLNDLQLSGEQQCAHNFRPLHPDILMSAGAIYQATFGDDYGIPATFRAISFIAWKPSKNQEKYIKERGSVAKGIQQKRPCSDRYTT